MAIFQQLGPLWPIEQVIFRISRHGVDSSPAQLLDRAGSLREHAVRVGAYESYSANHNHQNGSQHHSVLCDVLTFVVPKDFENRELYSKPRFLGILRFGKKQKPFASRLHQ